MDQSYSIVYVRKSLQTEFLVEITIEFICGYATFQPCCRFVVETPNFWSLKIIEYAIAYLLFFTTVPTNLVTRAVMMCRNKL